MDTDRKGEFFSSGEDTAKMEFKHSIFKRKSKGDHRKGKWYLRLRWKDEDTGRWHSTETQFDKRNNAIEALPGIQAKIRATAGEYKAGPDMTFNDLVTVCKKAFYHKATIENGMKTGGVKSLSTVEAALKNLSDYFGPKAIVKIDEADLRKYREWRREVGSRNPSLVRKGERREISSATINRELGICRRMFRFALDKGFMTRDVFRTAKAIHKRLEVARTRILTLEEVDLLLNSCDSIESDSLIKGFMPAAILLAVDSGLRKGEVLSLRWMDVDLGRNRVYIRREITKTETERIGGLTERTATALRCLADNRADDNPESYVFSSPINPSRPIVNISRQWKRITADAGLVDVRFHDLRRTAATILVRDLKFGLEFAGKLLGHSKESQITLRHYVAVDDAAITDTVDQLNEFHRNRERAILLSHVEN